MPSAPKTAPRPVRILIVEDSPTQHEELRYILEEEGISVVAAANGKEAFQAVKDNDIDLVISEIVMPEMNGYELCKALRQEKRLRHLPVILLTSLADPRDVIRGLEVGANNFLHKPYDGSTLIARVHSVLANIEIRKTNLDETGINVYFAGQRFVITADRLQILDLLLSTYENAVTHNTELVRVRDELRTLNEQLETRVAVRTAALTTEIAERRKAEKWVRLNRDVLSLLNRPGSNLGAVQGIVERVKQSLELDAAGIRLCDGEDFPYLETAGFPDHFVQLERCLCKRDEAGAIVRDLQGAPIFECMCGNVLLGRTDPGLPYFTEGGSFWTNDTTALLASMTDEDCRTRNRCSGEGYKSVALIPLRTGDEIIGLFQLNDRRPNQFTLEVIRFLEGICASIGIAVARQRSETALKREKAFVDRLVDTARTVILLLDSEGRIVRFNRYFEEISGYSLEEARGKDWVEHFLPEGNRPPTRELFRRAVSDIRTAGNIDPIVTKDGEERLIEWYDTTIKTDDGELVGLLCVGQDVTSRRQTEEALRASEDKFRNIFNSVLDGIVLTDPVDHKFAVFNQAFCDMTGYSAGELDELGVEDIHPQGALPHLLEQVNHGALSVPNVAGDVPVKRKDGSVFYADINGMNVKIGGKRFALGCFRDVTERNHLQAQLAQSDRLSTMGTLAAGVAHEINNPLSYVLFNLQSLLEDIPKMAEAMRRCHAALCARIGPEAVNEVLGDCQDFFAVETFDDISERFRDALEGTIRIKEISRGLGTFSRVERVEMVPISVHQAAEHAISMAFNEIKYRARLVKDFAPVPMVLASDGKLAQVFLNLFINAAHAIDAGQIEKNEIRIRTWAEGDHVFAEVSDTGKGIPPEHQAKLFEPFFTTKEVGVGTGLGLPICKTIISDFNGEISVTSEVGKGTRFLIRLPCIPSGWARSGVEVQSPASVAPKLRGRILVVDDEAGIRGAMVRLLARDHEVVTASSGEEGRDLLENDKRFDLIFCDLMMPKMSGMELHEWLSKQDPDLAGQVVFVTGGAFTPGAADYLRKVDNLQVEKPFDASAFRKMTNELVLAARAKQRA